MTSPAPNHPNHVRGIMFAMAGFALWVAADIFMKLAGSSAAPKYEMICVGSLSGMVTIAVVSALRGRLKELRPKKFRRLIILCFFFIVVNYMNLIAVAQLPLANFYVVVFLSPVLLAVFSALFLGEKLGLSQGFAILTGFAGVVIAVNPSQLLNDPTQWKGYAAVILGVICYTVQILTVRVLGRSESHAAVACFPRLGPFIFCSLMMLVYGAVPLPLNIALYSMAMGGLGGIGWMLIANAYKLAPVGIIAPFQYSELLYGAVAGYFIWGNVPTPNLVLGGVIIIASGLYILRHTHNTAKRAVATTNSSSAA
jgi:hypothetical protein